MTRSERNFWEMARLAVSTGNVKETFDKLSENNDMKTLQLFCLYVQMNRAIKE